MSQFEDIRDAAIAAIEERAKAFLDKNEPVRATIKDRASRLAELAVKYISASEADRQTIKTSMEFVKQGIANLIASSALDASVEARISFVQIVEVAFGTLIKLVPLLK